MPTLSGTTPQYAFPYPLESDSPDPASAFRQLALAVENLLKNQRIGSIEICVTTSPPTGAILLQGQAVTRTGTYAALYAKWGTRFGSGNGSSTFNLPDFRGKAPVGYKSGTATYGTLGASIGSNSQTLTTAQVPHMAVAVSDPGHLHTASSPPHNHNGNTGIEFTEGSVATSTLYINAGANIDHGNSTNVSYTPHTATATVSVTVASHTTGITATAGTVTNSPVSVVQPSIVVNFMAWYK